MGEFQLSAHLAQLNAVHREMDEVYHQTAKALGFSDGAFWILYAVREADGQLTQRELCDRMFMPKQTVNSALKKMEREGVLELRPAENRRGKRVFLGERGRALAERTVDALFAAETRALNALGSRQEEYLRLDRMYMEALREETARASLLPGENDEGENA